MSTSPPNAKRTKLSPEDDLKCPITRELLFDPVMAEDGTVYERESIEQYFKKKGKGKEKVKSPYKGTMMGQKLIPAPQIKSLIETLIENGGIREDLADTWKQNTLMKKKRDALIEKGEGGDIDAMCTLGHKFMLGCDGFEMNFEAALGWYDRGGSVRGLYVAALQLFGGGGDFDMHSMMEDWTPDQLLGFMHLTRAADKGSGDAAVMLGLFFGWGVYGVKKNKAEAVRLIKKAFSEDCDNVSDKLFQAGKETLQRLTESE